MMNIPRCNSTVLGIVLLAASVTGCEQEGPLEKLGEKADESIEQARDNVSDAIEQQGPLEKAGEKVDRAIEQAGEAARKATGG